MTTKSDILITTDSVCDLPDDLIQRFGIQVCPYIVKTPDGAFLDDVEIGAGEVIDYMERSGLKVSSASPSPDDYKKFFIKQKKDCSEILHISMGSGSSDGFANASQAAEDVPGVTVLDSGQISSGMGMVAIFAAREALAGKKIDEIVSETKKYASKVSSSFVVRNMKYLNRSGRLSDRTRRICEKLMLYPSFLMKEGRIKAGGILFGRWKNIVRRYIRHELKEFEHIDNEVLFLTQAGLRSDEIEEIKEETKKYADFKTIRVVDASPAISANCGRGSFGLLFAKEKKKRSINKLLKGHVSIIVITAFILVMAVVLGMNVKQFYGMTSMNADSLGREQLTLVSGKLNSTLYDAEIMAHKSESDAEKLVQADMDPKALARLGAYLNKRKDELKSTDCTNVYAAGEGWYYVPGFKDDDFVPEERDWYKGARKAGAGKVYITAPYQDLASSDMCVTVSELLPDEKTVVALDFSLASLQESLSSLNIEGGDALIVSDSGQIVAYSDISTVGKKLNSALPEYSSVFQKILSSGQDSMYFKTRIRGSKSTVFYSITRNSWYLLSVVSNSRLYRKNMSRLFIYLALNILFIVVMLILYLGIQRLRSRAEKRLIRTETAITDITGQMKEPLETVVRGSDYRMLLASDDPDEYMGDLKKSSVSLNSAVERLEDLACHSEDKKEDLRHIKNEKETLAQISSKGSRKAPVGIIAILFFTMVLCISVSTFIMINLGNTRMEREADRYEAELDSWITEQKSVLDMFVSCISVDPHILDDYNECVDWLNDITVQYDDISVSYMTNPEAEHIVIMNNGWDPDPGWKMEERSWYKGSYKSDKEDGFNITSPYYDSQLGAYCVTMSKRVYDKNGNYLGIFGIDFFLDKLTRILDSSYTDEGYAFLADPDGNIINHPDNEYQMTWEKKVSIKDAGYLKAAYSDRTVLLKDYDGREKAVCSALDASSGFSVFCVKDWNVIYGNLVFYDVILFIIFCAGIVLTIVLLKYMHKWHRSAVISMQHAIDEARQEGEAKSKFLAQMSHEIRTPINAVLGMNEMIIREASDPEILEYSNNINSAGRTLLALINSILDFSKIEDGKMEIVPVQYDTESLITDLVNMIRERAEKKDILFKLDIDSKLPVSLYGDDVRLRQIITNILTNAVKYTSEGYVILRIRVAGRTVKDVILHVEVEDTGMGIKEEDKDTLFESFARFDVEKNRKIEGTGLGMAITQKLLSMMDSSLQVESEYGKGSTFYFDIKQGIVDETPIGNYEEKLSVNGRSGEDRFVYAPEAHVLVVDDNNMNLKVAKGLLKRSAIQVDTAMSGHDAIDMTVKKDYDIIFLDHMMPELDGIETLHEMQRRGLSDSGTAMIMMTANAIAGAREEYLKDGFDDYISKPIEVKAMEKILKDYLPKEKLSFKTAGSKKEISEDTKAEEKLENTEEERPADAEKQKEAGKKQEKTLYVSSGKEEKGENVMSEKMIDKSVGMSYCMDDEEFYKEMLATYIEESAEKKKVLSEALEAGDARNYAIAVHALKSTSRTIGAVHLAESALASETAAKEGSMDFVKEHHDALMAEYDSVLAEAETMG